jgi:hypothetical protein
MSERFLRASVFASIAALALAAAPAARASDEKELMGSYALTKRVTNDGKELKAPDVVGFATFTKTHRTVIMKWKDAEGQPVSIAFIASYTLGGGKYCENTTYGVQSNLGAPGVSYDTPSETPACTVALSDASGLAFDIPGEKLRLRVTREGFVGTTPRWSDHWEKVK